MLRIFRHYVPKSLVILGTGEFLIFVGAVYFGVALDWFDVSPASKLMVGELWIKAVIYASLMILAMASMGLYQRSLRDGLRGVLFRAGLAMLVVLSILLMFLATYPQYAIGGRASSTVFIASVVGVLLFRGILLHFFGNDLFRRRVLVVGAGVFAAQVEELRRKVDRTDLEIIGFVACNDEPVAVSNKNLLRGNKSLSQLAMDLNVDELVVGVTEAEPGGVPINQLLDCKMLGIKVYDLVTFFEQQTGKIKLDALNANTLVFSEGYVQAVLKGYINRMFDVCVSLVLLSIIWPIMLLTALLIFVESGCKGPILYRQVRVGRNGEHFNVLKFRSMRVDAEKTGRAEWAATNDSRVTLVGSIIRKFRIDELPQLLNVLVGEMSFVGPRPERPEFVVELAQKIPYYDLRHRVNPGITGWAQICYPYGSSEKDAKEKLQFDLYYIKNYSLFLDLMILVQTAQVIIWGKGAR